MLLNSALGLQGRRGVWGARPLEHRRRRREDARSSNARVVVGWLVDAIFIPSEDSGGFSLIPQAPHHPACDKSCAAESAIKKLARRW